MVGTGVESFVQCEKFPIIFGIDVLVKAVCAVARPNVKPNLSINAGSEGVKECWGINRKSSRISCAVLFFLSFFACRPRSQSIGGVRLCPSLPNKCSGGMRLMLLVLSK